MPSNFSSLTVTWYDETDGYVTNSAFADQDIKAIPIFTDVGSGEVNQATIILNAPLGKFITSGNIIDKFDRIRIQCTDVGATPSTYDRFFEVDEIVPSQTKGEGTLLQLECLGIEYHTQKVNHSKPFFFSNAFDVGDDIASVYNTNRGTRQPDLVNPSVTYSTTTKTGSALPKFTVNNYEFGLNEDTCYNRWMDVIDKLGASVSAGGVLDFFELSFETLVKDEIRLAIFTSGGRSLNFTDTSLDNQRVTIKNTKTVNPLGVGEQEGVIANPTGTNVVAWGSPNHGSLPYEHSRYVSGLFQFFFRPEWDSTVTYLKDAKVKYKKQHYVAKIDVVAGNTPPFTVGVADEDTNWKQIDMGDEFGDTIQYSTWTDGHSPSWANCGSDPNGTGAGKMFFDSNIIIWDDKFFRTWVNARAKTDTELNTLASDGLGDGWSYDSTDRSKFPRGFRVLVETGTSGVFAQNSGKDVNDRTYINSVVEFVGRNKVKGDASEYLNWEVKYAIGDLDADQALDRMQVAVIGESRVYEWKSGTSTFSDVSTSLGGNDCFHPYNSVTQVTSVDPKPSETNSTDKPDVTKAGGTFSTNINSAVQVQYNPGALTDGNPLPTSPIDSYYKTGSWINFQFPFPPNTFNSITETVGQLYGGTSTTLEPATLDTGNMHFTHDGKRGFNEGISSQDLGPLNALAFMIKVVGTDPIGGLTDGEYKARCAIIDTSDNIVVQDFTVRFADNWQDIQLPLSGFQIYRAHKPLFAFNISGFADIITPKEIDVQNLFEWRNVKFIIIQLQDFYDEFGRFNPTKTEAVNNITINKTVGGTINLIVDAFRFVKPLLVTSGQDTTRNIESKFLQKPFISLYDQLLNDAKTMLEIEKFQHKQFDIKTVGDDTFNIRFGELFFLENSELINDADRNETTRGSGGGDANTIGLVAKKIEYSLTKPKSGRGGLERRIIGSKRFV